jgi:hypothetical protein
MVELAFGGVVADRYLDDREIGCDGHGVTSCPVSVFDAWRRARLRRDPMNVAEKLS